MLDALRTFRIHFIIFLCLLLMHSMMPLPAEDLPKEAQKYVADYEKEIAKLRKELVGNLNKSMVKSLKAADLNAANATKAKIEVLEKEISASTTDLSGVISGNGIQVKGDEIIIWDNKEPVSLSTSAHSFSFVMRTPQPVKQIWVRAQARYGSERVVLSIEGRSEAKRAREYNTTFQTAKNNIKITGEHGGSNDPFTYGPLQFKLTEEGEWLDIPTNLLFQK